MDGLTANDFLSSNGDDNYTGTGTLTFDAGTTLDVNGTFDATDAEVNLNGITNETFTLDEGGSGNNDVVLQFGADVGAAITWDDSESRFDFGDDVYVNGNLQITGTFTGDLADDTVETDDLQNSSVTSEKINDGAITTNKIATNAVTANEIANNTITAGQIANNAVTSDELADDAVDTNAIQNEAITTEKIADGAITSDKIGAGAITVNNLADYSITGTKIATGAITTNHIADGALTWNDLETRNKSTLISPEYPNFTLVGDGTNNRGTLDADRDTSDNKNYYSWTSRKTALNDYDIMVQYQIPDDFDSWQTNAIIVNYQTEDPDTTDNNIQVYVLDTSGSADYTSSQLASTSWTSTTLTSGNLNGTYTAGEYMTIGIKLSSRRDGASNG